MIDLATLPAPAIVEVLDYEDILASSKAQLLALMPADMQASIAATLQLESEPLTMLLQLCSYRELLLRQRINEAAKASLLAYAEKEDLDNKAADYGVSRLLITPADPTATPPVEAVWESDSRVRYRCQLALEGMTVAGPRGAYRFHALSASANVLDVKVTSPQPGTVRVYVMDARSNGVPDQPLLDAVLAYLSDETRIPLCDSVEVQAGQPRTFTITARLERDADLFAASGGLTEARRRLDAMLETRRRLGELLSLDDIIAAIKLPGVRRISLPAPAADIVCADGEFPLCIGVDLQ